MAAKQQQDEVQGSPLAPASIMPRSDAEFANNYQSEEQMRKKKKRTRCLAFIAIFAIIQIIVILIFSLAVVRVRTPKLRLDNIVVRSDPSGDARFTARVLVKNTNFARYRFDDTYATVRTRNDDNNVGQFLIGEGRARARSTKKITVIWDLRSSNTTSRSLDLIAEARMRGKVQVLKVFRRRKTAVMNCTMTVDLATTAVQNLRCN